MDVDLVARWIAIAGLAIALGGLLLTYHLWRQSGPRLRVQLSRQAHPEPLSQTLRIEVANGGRLPAVVRELGLRDHITVSTGASSGSTSLLTLPWHPDDGQELPRTLEPTAFLIANVPMTSVMERWDADKELSLVAWALSGDGRKSESRPLKIKTPPRA